jgi:hypothetical protein
MEKKAKGSQTTSTNRNNLHDVNFSSYTVNRIKIIFANKKNNFLFSQGYIKKENSQHVRYRQRHHQ